MLTINHSDLEIEVRKHVEADAIMAGHYWNEDEFTGCFIGCLTHSDSAQAVTDRFGFPLPLVKVCENIFEALPADEGKAFFAAIPDAVGRDGKDLSLVHWKFLALELRAMPAQPSHIQDVIDPVIAGIDLLAGGKEWDKAAAYAAARAADAAADAAARAADAAAADAAAYAAAYAAADAARAAGAARIRQRDTLLRLISEAQ